MPSPDSRLPSQREHACAPPSVLVLMATYNAGPWLDEQVNSVLAQEGVSVSILVSDHGSNDGTLERLEQRRAAGAPICVLPGVAQGRGSAANFIRLLRQCNLGGVSHIALADQDDVWLPQRLQRAISTMQSHGASAYSSDVLAIWPDGRETPVRKSQPQRRYDYLMEPAGPGCTYVLTAALAGSLQQELLLAPERFDAVHQHDWLIYSYARTHGHPWVIDGFMGIRYRQHEGNEVGANVGLGGIWRRWNRAKSGIYRRELLHIGYLWPDAHAQVLARFERFAPWDQLVIALSALKLRRRPKDQLALFSMLLLGVLG